MVTLRMHGSGRTRPGAFELVSEWYEQQGRRDGFENEDPKNWEHALSTTTRHKAAQLAPGGVPWCWNRDMPVREERCQLQSHAQDGTNKGSDGWSPRKLVKAPSTVESSRGKPAEASANTYIHSYYVAMLYARFRFAASLRWCWALEGAESEIENPRTCTR